MRIGILTDSLADLPHSYCKENNIRLMSSYVNTGRSTKRDDKIHKGKFYERIYTTEPTTKAPSKRDFHEVYTAMSAEYDFIFSIHTSIHLTSIILKASKVVHENTFGTTEIRTYDSGQISAGLNVIIRSVVDLIKAGCSVDEIDGEIGRMSKEAEFHCIIPVDRLIKNSENINRNHLGLKTNRILKMRNGIVVMGNKFDKMYKGVGEFEDTILKSGKSKIAISHSIAPAENYIKKNTYPFFLWGEVPDDLYNQVTSEGYDCTITVMNPSLIAHLGMGTIGIGLL